MNNISIHFEKVYLSDNDEFVSSDDQKSDKNVALSFNRMNYLKYEYQILHYHQKTTGQKTYHWKHIPEEILYESGYIHEYNNLRLKRKEFYIENGIYYNPIQEYGLDLISIEDITSPIEKSIYHGIQCKLWDNTIKANDLGTFINSIMFRLHKKNSLSKGYLYHTSHLQRDLEDDFLNSDGIILPHKVMFNMDDHQKEENKEKNNIENIILRPYQIDAIQKLNEEWNGIQLLTIPCGMGKTEIFSHHLKDSNYDNIFILSEYKIHVKQNLERVRKYIPTYNSLIVDSDSNGTTDYNIIKDHINKKSLISITYKSAQQLFNHFVMKKFTEINEDQTENDDEESDSDDGSESDDESDDNSYTYIFNNLLKNSIIIIDEAHNLISYNELTKLIKAFPKVLLVSATPPYELYNILNYKVIYNYSFHNAIKEKYICDYQIYLPLIEMNKNNVLIDIPEDLSDVFEKDKMSHVDQNIDELYKKCLFLINGLLQTGSRKTIVYLRSVEECNQFKHIFTQVVHNYHYIDFQIYNITSNTNESDRYKILNAFQDDREDKIKIITSIYILDECVNIPKCDSVFITHIGKSSSDIRTVQRICRANRLDEKNPNKIANCFLWTDDLNNIIYSLQLLKENDIEFYKKIKMINSNYDSKHKNHEIEKTNKINIDFNKFIHVHALTYNELWEKKKNILFEFCDLHNRYPKRDEIYKDIQIGYWLYSQLANIYDGYVIHENYYKLSENIHVKKRIDNYMINKQKIKTNYYDLFMDYCNNPTYTVPPPHKYKYKNMNIGKWYERTKIQIYNKNNIDLELYNKISIIHPNIKKNIDDYINFKNGIGVIDNIQLLREFTEKYGRVPQLRESYVNNSFGKWYSRSKQNVYKNNIINQELYDKLSINEIVKDDLQYYINFKNKGDIIDFNIQQIITFAEKYRIIPASGVIIDDSDFSIITKNELNRTKKVNKIGQKYGFIKKKIFNSDHTINIDLYNKLCVNDIIKKNIDHFIEQKKSKCV